MTSGKIVLITQAHPDKMAERIRLFALRKFAKHYPVYVVGPSDYTNVFADEKNITVMPFIYDLTTKSIYWQRLIDWMRDEQIGGAYFMDYDEWTCSLPNTDASVKPDQFFVIQSPTYRERKDNMGTHVLYGLTYIGIEVMLKLPLKTLMGNHWLRWQLIVEATQQGITPTLVLDDFVQPIHIDWLPYGSPQMHWVQGKETLDRALSLPCLPKLLGALHGDLTNIAAWCDNFVHSHADNILTAKDFFLHLILPLKKVLNQLLPHSSPIVARHRSKKIELGKVRSLGIIKLDTIADALLMTPMLKRLREYYDGEIRLLCSRQQYEFWQNCPYVDRVMPVESRYYADIYNMHRDSPRDYDNLIDYYADLAEQCVPFLDPCDAILLPRGSADLFYGLNLACLTSAPYRVMSRNYENNDAKWNNGYDQNITHLIPHQAKHPHEVDCMYRLLEAFDIPAKPRPDGLFSWSSSYDAAAVNALFKPKANTRYIVLAAGALGKNKAWPSNNFQDVLTRLSRIMKFELVLVGAGDALQTNRMLALESPVPAYDLTCRLTVPQSVLLLKHCHLLIGNASAPIHMACAAGIPHIEISAHALTGNPGNNNAPERSGTIDMKSVILQPHAMAGPPCIEGCYANSAHCVKGVTPEMVLKAAVKLLGLSTAKASQKVGAA